MKRGYQIHRIMSHTHTHISLMPKIISAVLSLCNKVPSVYLSVSPQPNRNIHAKYFRRMYAHIHPPPPHTHTHKAHSPININTHTHPPPPPPRNTHTYARAHTLTPSTCQEWSCDVTGADDKTENREGRVEKSHTHKLYSQTAEQS